MRDNDPFIVRAPWVEATRTCVSGAVAPRETGAGTVSEAIGLAVDVVCGSENTVARQQSPERDESDCVSDPSGQHSST